VIRIAIVDDDEYARKLLQLSLSGETDMECVGCAGSASGALELVCATSPDIIVLDLMLSPAPIELAASLVAASPHSQVIVCTGWSDNWQFDHIADLRLKVRASKNGITDWINKGEGIDELVVRLRAASLREPTRQGPQNPLEEHLENSLRNTEILVEHSALTRGSADVTPMERRVAAVVARGLEADLTVDEICRLRSFNTSNVRTHLKNIYIKWNVHGQAAFVAEARRRGLLNDS
jgi:DNA-binding NarL/FixJ family response regulator